MYTYIHSEHSSTHDLFTVGHYDKAGYFHTDSDHSTKEEAAARCSFLNGGSSSLLISVKVYDDQGLRLFSYSSAITPMIGDEYKSSETGNRLIVTGRALRQDDKNEIVIIVTDLNASKNTPPPVNLFQQPESGAKFIFS